MVGSTAVATSRKCLILWGLMRWYLIDSQRVGRKHPELSSGPETPDAREPPLQKRQDAATILLPEHPVPGRTRRTIAHSKVSRSCVDRSSCVYSVGC